MQGSNIYIYPKNIVSSNGRRVENVCDDGKKRGDIKLLVSMSSRDTNFFLDLVVGHFKRLLVAGQRGNIKLLVSMSSGNTNFVGGHYRRRVRIDGHFHFHLVLQNKAREVRREAINWVVCGNGVVQFAWRIALFIDTINQEEDSTSKSLWNWIFFFTFFFFFNLFVF